MPNFIISPYAISWESIRNQLQTYVKSKTEEETWKDFYISGAGETVIEIAAALGAFYAFHFIVGRRECYLSTAQNYTSLVGLAQNNGYSVARGTNLKININYAPSVQIPLHKWDIIGSYGEFDLVLTEDFDGEDELTPGRNYDLPVIVGNLVKGDDSIVIPTERLTSFTFHSDKTTDDFRIFLNNDEVPVSNEFKDLNKDYWVAITNTFGSVDVFYLQKGEYQYHPNDTLLIEYVEKNPITWSTFSKSNIKIDVPGSITTSGITLIRDRVETEDKEQVRLKAPLYHETSMVIRSRKDYSKFLLLANPKLIDANDRDITPGLIEVTYLAKDGSILSDREIEEWLDRMEEVRPSGVARAFITHPEQISRELILKIWKTDEGTSSTIDESINNILSYYNNKLGMELDLNQVEHDIERLDGVKIARVYTSNGTWSSDSNYKIFDTITNDNDDTFWVSGFVMKSGSTEPDFASMDVGDTVQDNKLIWERVSEYDGTVINDWKPDTKYEKFDYIRKDQLITGDYGQSGSTEPIWGREEIHDYRIVWTKVESIPEGVTPREEWLPDIVYFKDEYLLVDVGENVYYYKCTKCENYIEAHVFRVKTFVGTSGVEEPESWESTTYDGNIIWRRLENGVIPETYTTWEPNEQYWVGDNIRVDDEYYTLTSLIGTSGSAEPTWPTYKGAEVVDNDIIWTLMDENSRTLKLAWNQYFNITRTSEE